MLTTLLIAIITCILLILSIFIFPKIKIKNKFVNTYWIICVIGAILMIVFRSISLKEILQSFTDKGPMNPLKILILFFSMTILSIFLDEVGFFKFLAIKAAKIAKSNQLVLFLILYFLTAILTIFTSNDIVILTFTPFICYFCKNASIDSKPYLVSEFAAANTWSMMLIIGNPTNIYLATSANIDFISYFKIMAIPTLVAGLIELLIIYLLFKKKLKTPMTIDITESKIEDKVELDIGLIHLGVCLVLLIVSSYIHFSMWMISMICALSLLIIITSFNFFTHHRDKKILSTLKRAPYELIPFVLSMFIIVAAINKHGISTYLAKFLNNDYPIFSYGFSSFLSANIINNIPMSVLFSTIPNVSSKVYQLRSIYATIIGSNIGAFLTPIGALAGIMFTQLLSKYDVEYPFKTFIKYGIIIAIPTLCSALLMLMLFV